MVPSMSLHKTPEFIRKKAPEPAMKRIARWVIIFCAGWALSEAAHLAGEDVPHAAPAEVCR